MRSGMCIVQPLAWCVCRGRLCGLCFFLFLGRSRIYHYYLPTFMWCSKKLKLHRQTHEAEGKVPPAFVVRSGSRSQKLALTCRTPSVTQQKTAPPAQTRRALG